MPAELRDLPSSWTTYEPRRDGMTMAGADPIHRCEGHEAARVALQSSAARSAYDLAAELIHDRRLSRRERNVLELFCEGLGRPTIAERLDLSEGAVREVFRKLRSRYGLTMVPRRKQWRPRRPSLAQGLGGPDV